MSDVNSNADLLAYLRTFSDDLRTRGFEKEADDLGRAARFALGSPSEFLGEAREALQRTSSSRSVTLSEAEREKIRSVVAEIDAAFRRANAG